MPQLDTLRAIAVGTVMVHHAHVFKDSRDLALWGVQVFFVLSGFLITLILLQMREGQASSGIRTSTLLGRFYLRRSFRILPIYYLVLLIGFVLNLSHVREASPWLLTYTFNWYLADTGRFVTNFFHLWSLAVEEQFYLIWPLLILTVPRRLLLTTLLLMIAAGPVSRWILLSNHASWMYRQLATPVFFDLLGLGGLLAFLTQMSEARLRIDKVIYRSILPVSIMGLVAIHMMQGISSINGFVVLRDCIEGLLWAGVLCALVARLSVGVPGPVGEFLELAPFRYVGQISYGLYVYHPLIANLCPWLFRKVGLHYPNGQLAPFVIWGIVSLGVSAVSFHFLESPIRSLSKRIEAKA